MWILILWANDPELQFLTPPSLIRPFEAREPVMAKKLEQLNEPQISILNGKVHIMKNEGYTQQEANRLPASISRTLYSKD